MEGKADFHLIALTAETPVENEAEKIVTLLDSGFYRVHLRHPSCSRSEVRDILESVPIEKHRKIVLHGHFDLVTDFNLGGLHLNKRCPVPPSFYNGPLSRSCHSIEELRETDFSGMGYVTLSPIFDSISKQEYRAAFTDEELQNLSTVKTPVIALGGIRFHKIIELSKYNFSGVALLGDLEWERPITTFTQSLKNKLRLC